ncbi:hypothetical protein [Lysinibacillus pakistanensis]|uniref:Uncharacterized protein n=1 Tax=Lysinibacillus pakistanensis TaxID=759811 RepID=A0ABX6DA19_9BACI|nr:hypothetical protein GDS87_11830 [Lysinibacillus pakistanensis]
MEKIGDITVNLKIDDKTKLRLRAIAKHAGALADELDAIDAMDDEEVRTKEDFKKLEAKAKEIGATMKETMMPEVPTRLEGSE